jgi:hypothetical protein
VAIRNGLLAAFKEIQAALDAMDGLPDVNLNPLPPASAPFPALFLFWDDENLEMEGGDLNWIEPLNARAIFKVWLYVKSQQPTEMVYQLMEQVQLVKDAIKQATTDARGSTPGWKGNVLKVEPLYGAEQRVWGAMQITIQIGEYL